MSFRRPQKPIPAIPANAKRIPIGNFPSSSSKFRSMSSIPQIPEDAKRNLIDPLSTSESEDDFSSADERENRRYQSEESSEASLPVRHYDSRFGSQRASMCHDDRSRQPYRDVLQRQPSTRHHQNARFSTISTSTNSTSEDISDMMERYAPINKHAPRARNHQLGSIQEVSPIQPCLNPSSPPFVVPPPLSKDKLDFRPKYCSSLINMPKYQPQPNPTHRHQQLFASQRVSKHSHEPMRNREEQHRRVPSDISSDSSSLGPRYGARRGMVTSSPKRGPEPTHPILPQKFNLPAQIADTRRVKGIVFLSVSYAPEKLVVHLERAEYFSDKVDYRSLSPPKYRRKNRSSYVQVEMIHRTRDRSDSSRKRSSQRSHSSTLQRSRTKTVDCTDEPTFNRPIIFDLDDRNRHDVITVTVFEKEVISEDAVDRIELGCFTFHISKLRNLAILTGCLADGCLVEVIKDGCFILDSEEGRETNFRMSKIVRSTNYSLDTMSSASSSSSNLHTQQKMHRPSEWPLGPPLPPRSSSAFPPNINSDYFAPPRPRPLSHMEKLRYGMAPSMESVSSTRSSSIDYEFNRYGVTRPSIRTKGSSIMSDDSSSYSASNPSSTPSFALPGALEHKKFSDEVLERKPFFQAGLARIGSLTSLDYIARRPESVTSKESDALKKKRFGGGLSRMFSSIGSKLSSAISTSSLHLLKDKRTAHLNGSGLSSSSLSLQTPSRRSNMPLPTKEEVMQWEKSFEALLHHEYGQELFAEFLELEHASENLEFWRECEAFKQMKGDDELIAKRANEIYNDFIEPTTEDFDYEFGGSPCSLKSKDGQGVGEERKKPQFKVNLCSSTLAATKESVEGGRGTAAFALAQRDIEQLMKTDKYKTFLKHKLFLDVLSCAEKSENADE